MFSINLDPIVKCLEGIRSELARANKLSEEQLEMTESRYQQIAVVEAQFLDNAHMQTELNAVAHGYEKTEAGYELRGRVKPEVISGETQ